MRKSLYSKLVLIMMTIIVSLMVIVGAFLMRSVRTFYLYQFYDQMQNVFSTTEIANDLRNAANEDNAVDLMANIIKAYYGQLGIDSGTRNYYILSGDTGTYLTGSSKPANGVTITANITTAISGHEGYLSDRNADYMDVALPISGNNGDYIIYIIDNKATVQELSTELFNIIIESLLIGLVISIVLCLLLAKTMVTPLQELTKASKSVASGDFNHRVSNYSHDEIGVLTRSFNDMAGQLETTLDDLKASEQTRREFVANVSHELRTPITSISGYAETIMDDPDMPPEVREKFLNVIVNESNRMTNIVQDLLTLSKFDAGSIEFTYEDFDFKKSLWDVYNATVVEARKHSHDFTLKFKSEIPTVHGDRARIEQIVINMVTNAIKYTKDGGTIRITAGEKKGMVWCTVKDNGIGIPKQDINKVFDRFYRVDKARSRESGGTGLGLSIAREIAIRHGGDMSIQSDLGQGTAITVTLPVGGPKNA